VIAFSFETIVAKSLSAGHHPENGSSKKVLEKLGFRYTHDEFFARLNGYSLLSAYKTRRYFPRPRAGTDLRANAGLVLAGLVASSETVINRCITSIAGLSE